MDFTQKSKSLISLCTGMRGLERGIERSGLDLRALCYVEVESFIIENLVQQMEQGVLAEAPVWSNLKTFDGRRFRGLVDVLTAGFPCQGFSVAGKREGNKDPRHLWPFIGSGDKSIIGTVRPVCVFLENVPGLLTLGYDEVRKDLLRLGYRVKEGLFSAEEVGAPHQRKRLFILAVDEREFGRLREEYKVWAMGHTDRHGAGAGRGDDGEMLGVSEEERAELGAAVSGGASEEKSMAHAAGNGVERIAGGLSGQDEVEQGSEEQYQDPGGYTDQSGGMENATSQRWGGRGDVGEDGRRTFQAQGSGAVADPDIWRTQPGKYRGMGWVREQTKEGEAQGFSFGTRLEEHRKDEFCRKKEYGIHQGSCFTRTTPKDRWPAGPSEEQYEWEPPRIESKLGYVLDGYNFREDLLRMAGNAVVSQTAELAWVTLLERMFLK